MIFHEYIKDGVTGFLFNPEDVNDLVSKIYNVYSSKDIVNKVKENGHEWVVNNRTWSKVLQVLLE